MLDETHSDINTLFPFKPGDQVSLGILRSNREINLTIMLGESSQR